MKLDPTTCAKWHAENLRRADEAHAQAGWQVAATAELDRGPCLQVERLRSSHPRGDFVRGAVPLSVSLDAAAERLLIDQDAHVSWDPTLDRFVLHDQLEVGGVTHRLLQIPVLTGAHPLVRNREFVYHEAIVRTDRAVTTVGGSRPAGSVSPFAGHRRAWLGLSHRQVATLDGGRVRYRALWQTDLGGWLPRRAVTGGQVRAMLDEHRRFWSWWPDAAEQNGAPPAGRAAPHRRSI